MPCSFKFINNETNEMVPLAEIDDKVAQYLGETPQPIGGNAVFMDMVAEMGIKVLMSEGGSFVTSDTFDKLIDRQSKELKEKMEQNEECKKEISCFRKFLYEDYTFHAWR